MDVNKVYALKAAGYQIRECCMICREFRQTSKTAFWGTCKKNKYHHGKHTGPMRECSVCLLGWCKSFEMDEDRATELIGHYMCLMPSTSGNFAMATDEQEGK